MMTVRMQGRMNTTINSKLGWSVKMRSMQDDEFSNRWVGSDISWCNPCIVVNELMSVPSGDVMSSGHHVVDLALKLPIIIVKDGLSSLTKLSKFSSIDFEIDRWLVDSKWLSDSK